MVGFQQNLGQKTSVMDASPAVIVRTISVATDSHRDITNRNQPLLLFHMNPTNIIAWARKSFTGSVVPYTVGFQQNLGQKT
jgi:hypothetical protein